MSAVVPVVYESYPAGEAGIQRSIAWMARSVREGAKTPEMKSFAAHVLRLASFPERAFARFVAWLDYVRKNVAYSADCPGTEQIQNAAISLCVDGAPICIPIGDCDDLVVALATLIMGGGYEVEIVRQYFGEEHQQHVLMKALDPETGTWVHLDPSSKMPAGHKAGAVKETTVSPRDDQAIGLVGAPDAEFVGVGALPVLEWKGNRWTMHDASKGLGACDCDANDNGRAGVGQALAERSWQRHAGPIPDAVTRSQRGVSVFHGGEYWHVHPTGEVYVHRGNGEQVEHIIHNRAGLSGPAVPYQFVADGTVKAGLRYQVKMQLSFDYDPSDKVIVEQLRVNPEQEARARFAADWTIESMVPDGTVRTNVGALPYIQNWIMVGIATRDLVLQNDPNVSPPIAQPFVNFLGLSVQASSAKPATPPQATKAPPPSNSPNAPSSFGIVGAIVIVTGTAIVGGLVWHGYKEGWFKTHPHDKGYRFRGEKAYG